MRRLHPFARGPSREGGGDLSQKITAILEENWSPDPGDHEETIYYLAGYLIRSAHNRAEDTKELLREYFALLEQEAFVKKMGARDDALLTGRVE